MTSPRMMVVNSHPTRKGNAWKFVKTLHVKFFPLARKWPARRVTVNLKLVTSQISYSRDVIILWSCRILIHQKRAKSFHSVYKTSFDLNGLFEVFLQTAFRLPKLYI